jgi:hypothetical protein
MRNERAAFPDARSAIRDPEQTYLLLSPSLAAKRSNPESYMDCLLGYASLQGQKNLLLDRTPLTLIRPGMSRPSSSLRLI